MYRDVLGELAALMASESEPAIGEAEAATPVPVVVIPITHTDTAAAHFVVFTLSPGSSLALPVKGRSDTIPLSILSRVKQLAGLLLVQRWGCGASQVPGAPPRWTTAASSRESSTTTDPRTRRRPGASSASSDAVAPHGRRLVRQTIRGRPEPWQVNHDARVDDGPCAGHRDQRPTQSHRRLAGQPRWAHPPCGCRPHNDEAPGQMGSGRELQQSESVAMGTTFVVSEGGLEPPRPIKDTSTSS